MSTDRDLVKKHLGLDVIFPNLEAMLLNDGSINLHKCVMMTNKYPKLNDFLEEYLIACDDINKVDCGGFSLLHLAARHSRNHSTEKTVEILINADINVNLQDNYGATALHYSVIYSKNDSTEKTVEILINAGINVNLQANNGATALHYSAIYLNSTSTFKTVEMLIQADADVFNLKHRNKAPIDYFSPELIEYCQIDKEAQTIGIKSGKFTKVAKK